MKTIELEYGEILKVIGQKDTYLIVMNLEGDIFTRTDSKRDCEEEGVE